MAKSKFVDETYDQVETKVSNNFSSFMLGVIKNKEGDWVLLRTKVDPDTLNTESVAEPIYKDKVRSIVLEKFKIEVAKKMMREV